MVAGGLAAAAEALAPGTTVLVTRDGAGMHASGGTHYSAVSTAGKCVAFDSSSTTMPGATGGKRQIYVRDIDAGTTELVSTPTGGTVGGDGDSFFPVITPDCRYVAYDSEATNLTAGTQTQRQVYRRDLQTDTTILISRATGAGAASDRGSSVPSISDDGNRVSFAGTSANLASDDSDGILHDDVFVRKVTEAETLLVSRNDADAAQDSLGEATGYTDISGDGSKVGFDSTAHNLSTEDADNGSVFIRDIDAGTTLLASRSGGPTGPAADGPSGTPSLNGDGTKVLFQTSASNLGASGTVVIVVRDVTTGATQIVSRASGATGELSNSSTGGSGAQILSSDGTRAAFWSFASNLDPAATTTGSRVYVRDLTTATTALQTPPPANTAPEFGFAPDGSAVSFMTAAQLSADDTDTGTDIYARGVTFTPFVPPNPNPNPPGPDPDPNPAPAVVTPTPTP
ncbi:MAG: hypothetical protein QOJ12_510, partial [Thermoleophilales bacterium]|nr:hypothetical protein [Thermoleophilales bacterium]